MISCTNFFKLRTGYSVFRILFIYLSHFAAHSFGLCVMEVSDFSDLADTNIFENGGGEESSIPRSSTFPVNIPAPHYR